MMQHVVLQNRLGVLMLFLRRQLRTVDPRLQQGVLGFQALCLQPLHLPPLAYAPNLLLEGASLMILGMAIVEFLPVLLFSWGYKAPFGIYLFLPIS